MLLHVDYFDKEYLDWQHPDKKNTVMYQLSYSEGHSDVQQGFSQRETFYDTALDIFKFLRTPTSFKELYQLEFSERTTGNITKKEKKILEEIIALHNDFSTPRTRSNKKYTQYAD